MKLENAKVTITLDDPNELLESMDSEERLSFLQSLSCHDEVLEYVMQQVFEVCTDDGHHGSIACSWNGREPLQVFRQKMLEVGANDTAKRRISELEQYMTSADNRCAELIDENMKLKRLLDAYEGGL